ncbi:MAG: response regulator [Streptosporangiales bacterium]
MAETRVVVVDDQELVRDALATVIDATDGMRVVGRYADGEQAVSALHRLGADVVLMDIQMPRMDGLEATGRVLALPDAPRVLVLTTFDLDSYAFATLRAGASGFLLKDASAQDVVAAIRAVAAGDSVLAPSTTRRLLDHAVPVLPGSGGGPHERLTERETEVLVALASGGSNAGIGKELFLSESTVKTHVKHLLAKLGLRDRVQAVIYAYEHGLVRRG